MPAAFVMSLCWLIPHPGATPPPVTPAPSRLWATASLASSSPLWPSHSPSLARHLWHCPSSSYVRDVLAHWLDAVVFAWCWPIMGLQRTYMSVDVYWQWTEVAIFPLADSDSLLCKSQVQHEQRICL